MKPEELMAHFSMQSHIENGAFVEKHYENRTPGRAASGLIYYYVAPEELTEFHSIDCDEYWCYTCGAPLELWQVDQEGKLRVELLGTEEGCKPAIYLEKGVKFGSKHPKGTSEGTFLCCVTVPRFCYEGFTMYTQEEMEKMHPETATFYR